MMSERDKLQLRYLAKVGRPLWGGHLERGEPLSDPDMQRWIESGWITPVDRRGYVLTAQGLRLLQQTPGA